MPVFSVYYYKMMKMMLLQKTLELDKSALGICRGIQFINAALGGALYQDISAQHPSAVEHHQSAPYDIPVHKVTGRHLTC